MKLQFIIVLFFRIVVGYDSLINILFLYVQSLPPSLPPSLHPSLHQSLPPSLHPSLHPSLSPINNCNMTINLLKKINSCNKNTTCFLFVYKNQFDSCSSLNTTCASENRRFSEPFPLTKKEGVRGNVVPPTCTLRIYH